MTPEMPKMLRSLYVHAKKVLSAFIAISFLSTSIPINVQAQAVSSNLPGMPRPGVMVHLSPDYRPAALRGMSIYPQNSLKFDFIIDRGEEEFSEGQKRQEYQKLIKYFLASLTISDQDQWVNLSPYEKNRIIKDDFGLTEMGRDLLAQDYFLKQITSSLIYPEDQLGKKFWDRVYERAYKEFRTTNIPVNTFNKVWIVPDEAVVYESGNSVVILKSHLKVMLEEDYLSLEKHTGITATSNVDKNQAHQVASSIIKEIILPELEKDVNEGKNFANLRQIFSGMILATWFKKSLKNSLLGKVYADKGKTKGVDQDPAANQVIYQQYLKAFKKGVFNYIKEDVDKYTNEPLPRKYFSGGFGKTGNTGDLVLTVFGPGEHLLGIDSATLSSTSTPDSATVELDGVDIQGNGDLKARGVTLKRQLTTNKKDNMDAPGVLILLNLIKREGNEGYKSHEVSLNDMDQETKDSLKKGALILDRELNLLTLNEVIANNRSNNNIGRLYQVSRNGQLMGYIYDNNPLQTELFWRLKEISELVRTNKNKLVTEKATELMVFIDENKLSLKYVNASTFDDGDYFAFTLEGQMENLRELRGLDRYYLQVEYQDPTKGNVFGLEKPMIIGLTETKYKQLQDKVLIDGEPIKTERLKEAATMLRSKEEVNAPLALKILKNVIDRLISSGVSNGVPLAPKDVYPVQIILLQKEGWEKIDLNRDEISELLNKKEEVYLLNGKRIKLNDLPLIDLPLIDMDNITIYQMKRMGNPEVSIYLVDYKPLETDIVQAWANLNDPERVSTRQQDLESFKKVLASNKLRLMPVSTISNSSRVLNINGGPDQFSPNENEGHLYVKVVGLENSKISEKLPSEIIIKATPEIYSDLKKKGMITHNPVFKTQIEIATGSERTIDGNNSTKPRNIQKGGILSRALNTVVKKDMDNVEIRDVIVVNLQMDKGENEEQVTLFKLPNGGYITSTGQVLKAEGDKYETNSVRIVMGEKGRLTIQNNSFSYLIINTYNSDVNQAMVAGNPAQPDQALTSDKVGGIDLNSANLNLQIKRDGNGVPLPLDQQDMNKLMQIQGFIPNIIEIKPAANLPIFLELQAKLS